jgi:predicted nucleotidyltransferase component of viral defense system
MLHTETVEPGTFSILKELMQLPGLENFTLVGGTALSLLYGHRVSVDLDLFSAEPFDNEVVIDIINNHFKKSFTVRSNHPRFGIFCFIGDTKVDIIRHPHELLRDELTIDGIRMFSQPDIMAMKVQAILNRGKKKDFWDVAELLQHYTIADFVQFHQEKYSSQNLMITVPQALTYFSDAAEDEAPRSLKGQTWESVQAFISLKVREYLS